MDDPFKAWKTSSEYVPGFTPQEIYDHAKAWDFPPSEYESALLKEIDAMPSALVHKASKSEMEWSRMVPGKCHENVAWYVDNDPEKLSEMISGWILMPGAYVLHSVVRREGNLFCITPTPFLENLVFRPDAKIVEQRTDDHWNLTRGGKKLSVGVRRYPESVLRKVRKTMQVLNAEFGCT